MKTRTIVVSRDETGRSVAALLKAHLHVSWSQARRLVQQKRVRQGPALCRDSNSRVRAGQKLRVHLDDKPSSIAPQPRKGPRPLTRAGKGQRGGGLPILQYVDEHIVVVEKPAGLTTMRHGYEAAEFGTRGQRFLPATLADLLPGLLAPKGKGQRRLIAVHRLDRDTSGLVVFARSAAAARHLGAQFRAHTTERTYLAVVRGRAKNERIETYFVSDRGDGRRGSTTNPGEGQRAVTEVRAVEDLGDFTLVECRLETGRTHQVRIHLGERGTPICGERIYDRPLHGTPVSDRSGVRRLALHAATLVIDHPATGQRMSWQSPLPPDMKELVVRD
jgi:23S rRNA pseudouridine1911/1915/1917 synthase